MAHRWRTASKVGKVKVRYANGLEERVRAIDLKEGWTDRQFVDYYAYLKSPEWQRLRKLVRTRDGERCRRCRSSTDLHVHHITYERLGKERLTDLVTLCGGCHLAHHEGTHPWEAPQTPSPIKTKRAKRKATPVEKARNRKRSEINQALRTRERMERYAKMWAEAQGGEVTTTYSTRAQAKTQPCPVCHAGVGEPCIGKRGARRKAVHAPRFVRIG